MRHNAHTYMHRHHKPVRHAALQDDLLHQIWNHTEMLANCIKKNNEIALQCAITYKACQPLKHNCNSNVKLTQGKQEDVEWRTFCIEPQSTVTLKCPWISHSDVFFSFFHNCTLAGSKHWSIFISISPRDISFSVSHSAILAICNTGKL